MRDAILILATAYLIDAVWRAHSARKSRKQWEALVERLRELKHTQ